MTNALEFLKALVGGGLIGLSSAILILLNGRIAGISGIVASLFRGFSGNFGVNLLFVIGLLLGPFVFKTAFGVWPSVTITTPWPLLIAAGLLVGFGTRLGSGCTSGHGVSGLARLSWRSLAAVVTFMATAIITVLLLRIGGMR